MWNGQNDVILQVLSLRVRDAVQTSTVRRRCMLRGKPRDWESDKLFSRGALNSNASMNLLATANATPVRSMLYAPQEYALGAKATVNLPSFAQVHTQRGRARVTSAISTSPWLTLPWHPRRA